MVVNLIILGILLVFLIVGIVKGFIKQLFGFIGGILSFVLAAIFCEKLVDMVAGTEVFDKVKEFFMSLFPVAEDATIESLNLPEFIVNLIKSFMENNAEASLAESVATSLTRLTFMFAAFILIVIAVKLVSWLLSLIFGAIFKKDALGAVNRILGGVVGLIKGAIVISAILFLMQVLQITQIEEVQQFMSQSVVAEYFMKYNIFTMLFSMIAA